KPPTRSSQPQRDRLQWRQSREPAALPFEAQRSDPPYPCGAARPFPSFPPRTAETARRNASARRQGRKPCQIGRRALATDEKPLLQRPAVDPPDIPISGRRLADSRTQHRDPVLLHGQ